MANWTDPDYEYLPWVFEGINGWVQMLGNPNLRLPAAKQQNYIDMLLSKIPEDSRTYMLALGGVIAGGQRVKSPLVSIYAKKYVEKYKATEPEAVARLNQILRSSASFTPGGDAPDFTMNTPEGAPMKLSAS